MSNSQKISQMTPANVPLGGAELVPIVQNGNNVKVAVSEIGAINNLSYQGTWDANTNTPAIVSGAGTTGFYYIVNVAGATNIDGISSWSVGDWIIFSNTGVWQRISGGIISSLQIANDSSTNTNYNLTMTTSAGGVITTETVDSGILSYNPSEKELTVPNLVTTIQPVGEVYNYFRKTNGWNVASINVYDAPVTGGPNPPVNGGYFEIYTSDGVTEQAHQLNFNWNGALGFSDNAGTVGQVPISAGFEGATHWGDATEIAGLGTMAFQNAGSAALTGGTVSGVAVSGGSINNTPIGGTTPSTGKFTNLWSTSLTPTRVVFVGTGGQLIDDAELTYDSSTNRLSTGTLTVTTGRGFTLGGAVSALYYEASQNRVTMANYNANGILVFEVNGGNYAGQFRADGVFESFYQIKTQSTTVGALPSAAAVGAGGRSFVTDCNTATFNAVAAGGGSNKVPVFSDGTAWRVG